MGLISKPYTFTNGTTADATEVNADFDTLYNAVNGGLDEDNLSPSAAIPNSALVDIDGTKVVGHADDLSTYIGTTSPGDTGTPSLPGNLKAELERIRYRIQANAGFISQLEFMDNSAASAAAAGWIEPSVIGSSLLVNAGFEYDATGSLSLAAPQGWTLVGSPNLTTITAAGTAGAGGHKRSFRFTTDASNEGVSQQIQGLKAGTKYLVGAAYLLNAGQFNITTSGGVSSADYEDLAISDTITGSFRIQQGIVKTDTSASDVTVSLLGAASGADVDIFFVWFRELGDNAGIGMTPSLPIKSATYTTADDAVTDTLGGTWANLSDLTLAQYVPGPGYRLTFESTLCFRSSAMGGSNSDAFFAFRIQQNTGGGASTVEGPVAWTERPGGNSGNRAGGAVTIRHVVDNPTPGLTYTFTIDAFVEGDDAAEYSSIIFNPTIGSSSSLATQSSSRLIPERV